MVLIQILGEAIQYLGALSLPLVLIHGRRISRLRQQLDFGRSLKSIFVSSPGVLTEERFARLQAEGDDAARRPHALFKDIPMANSVCMRSFDLARSGANLAETVLTPAAVRKRGIKKVATLEVAGDARGCEAQPLYAGGITCGDGKVRDLIILATMGNVVEAFDAATFASVWRTLLLTPVKGTKAIDAWGINDNWGILSTPVIDPVTKRLYVCFWSSSDATVANARFELVELDLSNGVVMRGCLLAGATYAPGRGLPVQHFNKAQRKQRAALTLSGGVVHIPFGTIAESAATAQGWIIGVDVESMTITAAWASTCRGSGGGIWQAGEGPAVDSAGDLIFTTGNGDFDGVTDFGECVVKLSLTDGAYSVADWWSPWADEEREGGPAVDTDPVPTNYRNRDGWGDQDMGSAAPLLCEDLDLVIVGCKDGIAYPVRHADFGMTVPEDFGNKPLNYGKLAAPAIFATFPGFGHDPMPQDATTLNFLPFGKTAHQHAAMTRFGEHVFVQGENNCLKAYAIGSDGNLTWVADGAQIASANCRMPPGGMTAVSANGSTGAILWCCIPYGDANMSITNGRFLAYDIGAMANGEIPVLWDLEVWADTFLHNKFNVPVPVNGMVLRPNYSGGVDVYQLA